MSYAPFAITPGPTGATVAAGAASANVAIPNGSHGGRPRYVRLIATGNAHVKLGGAAVAATATDMLIGSEPVTVTVLGHTHVAAIQNSAACTVQVQPLDD